MKTCTSTGNPQIRVLQRICSTISAGTRRQGGRPLSCTGPLRAQQGAMRPRVKSVPVTQAAVACFVRSKKQKLGMATFSLFARRGVGRESS